MKQTRRDFLKGTVGAIIAAGAVPSYSQTSLSRPNILWISCEDISSHVGCYGEKHAMTPHIDEMAAEGVRYSHAFTVHGVCAPSRSGIITGRYPSGIGTVNMRCQAIKPGAVKCFPEYLRQAGYYCTNTSKEDYNFQTPRTVWDQSNSKAHWKNRPSGKPFFAVFNFTPTHESKLWNSADFDNTHPGRLTPDQWQKPETMEIPPIYPDAPEVRRDFARLFERITEFDYYVKDRVDELKKAGLYENTIIFIWSDHGNGLPRAKRWLYDSGTRVPLIICIPEQYRTGGQAQPNTVDDRLVNFIDLGPTVLNLLGLAAPEAMQGRPFLGANLPAPRQYIFGARQRIDELYDMVRAVRDKRYRYIRNFMPFVPYLPHLEFAEKCNTMKAMRKLHAKGELPAASAQWMADVRPAEELYDLQNDPWETRNLAGDPNYAEIKKRLRKTLEDWMVQTRDTGLMPEPEMLQLARQYGGECQIFQQADSQKRVKKLLKLAVIASQPDQSDIVVVDKALADDDPVARYWAALALRGDIYQHQKGLQKLSLLCVDPNLCVRVAAAWSLSMLGEGGKAVTVLENELKRTDQADDSLQFALKVLDMLGADSRAALKTVHALYNRKKDHKYIARISKHFIEKYQ